MQEKNSIVEEALLQMKQVEEAISENAKGILASTMKEEISQLVKESLNEQDEDDKDEPEDVPADTDSDEDEVDVDTDKEDFDDTESDDTDDSEEMTFDDEPEDDDHMGMSPDDESPIDLTHASDEEILKVFKAMGEDDGIIVKKDGSDVHLTDNDSDTEYIIKLGESKTKRKIMEDYKDYEDYSMEESDDYFMDDERDSSLEDVLNSLEYEPEMEEGLEETIYEIQMDEEMDEELEESGTYEDMDYSDYDNDETIYEIHMDEEMDEELDEEMDEESMEGWEHEESYNMDESYSHKKSKKSTIKPKGIGMGTPKFSYKKTTGGFDENKKEGPKSVGTGKAKFEYKEGENMGGKNKTVKKTETKESARTLGNGRSWGRHGLPKPRTAPRHLKVESLEEEVSVLREKNEEYRKALNVFREKLNEVAIFNSNLAYATRLFTEHSTTKKEKINILRRFDDVETLKESKALYKNIKDELSNEQKGAIQESVEVKLNKTVTSGSASNLIESKTYENPQFMRIKDLMTKII